MIVFYYFEIPILNMNFLEQIFFTILSVKTVVDFEQMILVVLTRVSFMKTKALFILLFVGYKNNNFFVSHLSIHTYIKVFIDYFSYFIRGIIMVYAGILVSKMNLIITKSNVITLDRVHDIISYYIITIYINLAGILWRSNSKMLSNNV